MLSCVAYGYTMSSMKGQSFYRRDIDGLRAVAVLLVVIFHAFPNSYYSRNGFIGVDIFFVISGFLITGIILSGLKNNSFSFIDFYHRRIRRIFPALLLMLFVALGFGYFALLADEYQALGGHVFAGAAFVSNLFSWQESMNYFDLKTKPLLHLWSLGIEEQFYILWPLVMFLAYKKKYNLPVILSLLWLASFAYNIAVYHNNTAADFYSPFSRFWELMTGALLACWPSPLNNIANKKIQSLLRHVLSLSGVGIIAYAMLFKIQSGIYPGWGALPVVLGSALILMAGATSLFNKYILGSRLLVAIGLISYPLYLWHWPILIYLRIINQEELPLAMTIAAVAASFVLAFLTYRFIEKPIRFGKNQTRKSFYLLGGMVVVAVLGAATYHYHGLPWRIKDKTTVYDERQFVGFNTDATDIKNCKKYFGDGFDIACAIDDKGANKTILLLGDSHALESYYGIKTYLENKPVNVIMLSPWCQPTLLGMETMAKTAKHREGCRRHLQQITTALKNKKDITDVFFAFRGTHIKGYGYWESKPSFEIIPPHLYQQFFQNTIDVFNSLGKHVHYLTDNPEFRHAPRNCLWRPILFKPALNCDVTLSDMAAAQSDYLNIIKEIHGAEIIYSLPYFCPHGVCHVYNEQNEIMYRDNNHLSRSGSLWQARHILAPMLDKIAKQ